MTGNTGEAWSLHEEDRGLLRQLVTTLRRLIPLARSNHDLIALGEAWEAIQRVLDGAGVEVSIALSVGFRDGDDAFNEGLFVCFRIGPDGIVLDKLSTTYSVEIGSDHSTKSYAVLEPSGGFDGVGVAEWLDQLNEMRRWSTAELHTQRGDA